MTPARSSTTAVAGVLLAAGLLLVLVTWAASIGPDRVASGGHIEHEDPVPSQTTSVDTDPVDPVEEERNKERGEPPAWVRYVAYAFEALIVALGALLLFLVVRKAWDAVQTFRFKRREHEEPELVAFEVVGTPAYVSEVIERDAVEQRAELVEEGEPRNAIVQCWHRFEVQAVRAGVGQRPWQTTSEFVLDVLERVGADQGAVARLADLYREARFSDHPMTEEHRRAALEALDRIHGSLPSRVGPAVTSR